mgnify:CR=1 FL=1
MIIEESIIGGIISKIINDGTDISKSAIEQAVKKKCKEKSIQCQLYQAIVNTFNYITYNRHTKKQADTASIRTLVWQESHVTVTTTFPQMQADAIST